MINKGFTLLELLLSISIIFIIWGLSFPVFNSLYLRNALAVNSLNYTQSIRLAQMLAQANNGDSQWGVNISTTTITIFKGSSYASRDVNYDEIVETFGGMQISGMQEIVFDKMTGLPLSIGTTTIVSNNNETSTIFINAIGTITY